MGWFGLAPCLLMFTTCVANFAIGIHRWKTKSAACGGLVWGWFCLVCVWCCVRF